MLVLRLALRNLSGSVWRTVVATIALIKGMFLRVVGKSAVGFGELIINFVDEGLTELFRTALSAIAILVAVMYLILGQSLIGGIEEGIIQATENGLTGQIHVKAADYPDQPMSYPVDELVELGPEAKTFIEEHAVASTGRLMFVSTVVSGSDNLRLRGIGFDPSSDEGVFHRSTWKVEGKLPEAAEDGVLIGATAARMLEAGQGDRVVLQTRTHAGAINALDMPVAGVVATGNIALDMSALFMTRDLAAKLVQTDLPSHVALRLKHRDDAEELRAGLQAALGSAYTVTPWHDEAAELLRMQKIRRKALSFFVGILLIMSAFAIANTIVMATHERIREIGTLRAMGMSRGGIVGLFLTEGAILGLVAGIGGAAIGSAGSMHLKNNPVDLAEVMGDTFGANMQFSSYLFADFSWAMVFPPLLIALAISLLASAGPAWSASKMAPADAVRAK